MKTAYNVSDAAARRIELRLRDMDWPLRLPDLLEAVKPENPAKALRYAREYVELVFRNPELNQTPGKQAAMAIMTAGCDAIEKRDYMKRVFQNLLDYYPEDDDA